MYNVQYVTAKQIDQQPEVLTRTLTSPVMVCGMKKLHALVFVNKVLLSQMDVSTIMGVTQ